MASLGNMTVDFGANTEDLKKGINDAKSQLSGFDRNVQGSVKNLGELRREFKALSQTSLVGKTPQEIDDVKRRLASLRDEMGDMDATINSLSLDPFQKFSETVGVVSKGMAGLAGAATLFGGNQEELNKLTQKTIALIAIGQAAQEAADFTKQRAAGIWLKTKTLEIAARIKEALTINTVTAAATTEAAVKTKGVGITGLITKAQMLWNAAVASNPIGLMVVAAAALAAGVGFLAYKLSETTEESNSLNTAIDGTRFATTEAVNKHNEHVWALQDLQDEYLLLTGAISDYDIELNKLKRDTEKQTVAAKQAMDKELEETKSFWESKVGQVLKYTSWLYFVAKKAEENTAKAREEILTKNNEEVNRINELQAARELLIEQKKINRQKALDEQEARRRAEERAKWAKFDQDAKERELQNFNKYVKDLQNAAAKIEPIDLAIDWGETDYEAQLIPFNEAVIELGEMVNASMNDMVSGIAEGVGMMAAGEAGIDDVFKGIGNSVADFSIGLGKSLIAAGLGAIAFKKLLAAGGGPLAIAAGVALVAAGSFVKSKLAAGPSGSGGGGAAAPSGGGGGGGGSFSGERGLFGTTPMVVTVTGELVAKGNDLVTVFNNENRRADY